MTTSDALQELFEEIHSLSAELKKLLASAHGSRAVLVATKSLLQTLVDQGPQTVPSIAEARRTSRQNIQIMADRLAQRGWVEFVPNPNHRKSELVRLTDKGLAQLKASAQAESRMLSRLAADLSEQDLQEAQALLRRLHLLIGEHDPAVRSERRSGVSKVIGATKRLGKPHGEFPPGAVGAGSEHEPAKMDSGGLAEPGVQTSAQQNPEDDESLPLNLL